MKTLTSMQRMGLNPFLSFPFGYHCFFYFYRPQTKLREGIIFYTCVSFCSQEEGSLSGEVSVRGVLCPGGSLSRGASVQGVLSPGGLCPGDLCPGGHCPGGLCSEGVSVWGGLCLGGLC